MSKVRLYIARHGKTMFNTIGRAQGWSDTPLTTFGELGIKELGLGLKASNISFKEAFSSETYFTNYGNYSQGSATRKYSLYER